MSDDGGLYNPDGYGCRKRVLQTLAVLAALVTSLVLFLCL